MVTCQSAKNWKNPMQCGGTMLFSVAEPRICPENRGNGKMIGDLFGGFEVVAGISIYVTTDSFLVREVRGDKEMVVPVARVGRSDAILSLRNHDLHTNGLRKSLYVLSLCVEVTADYHIGVGL